MTFTPASHLEETVVEHFHTSTDFMDEAISHWEMLIEDVKSGSVVLQLKPITDQAVQNLLNAKENNNLLHMVLGMLKQIDRFKLFGESQILKINVEICSTKPQQGEIYNVNDVHF